MTRCFVAIWPDETVVSQLRDLPTRPCDGVRWVPPENWHITVRFLGDVDIDSAVEALTDAFVDETLPATEITLGPAVTRLGEKALVLPAAGADEISRLVDGATAAIGVRRRHPFVGHLTLARLRPPAHPDLVGHQFDTRFRAREIVVATSNLDPSGVRYTRAAALPLPMS